MDNIAKEVIFLSERETGVIQHKYVRQIRINKIYRGENHV
jgi:hypothetical protein